MVNNTLSFQTIPPGVIEDTPSGHAPALLARLLQLRRAAPLGLAVSDAAGARRRRHRDDRFRGHHRVGRLGRRGRRRRRARRRGSCSRDADGAEVASGLGAAGSLEVPDVHLWAPGDGYLYDLEVQLRRRRRVSFDSYPPERRRPHRRGPRNRVPDQRRTVLLQGLRHARGPCRHRQGAQQRPPGARLRAARLDRRQLLPHLALPLQRGRPRLRRPARHRRHRRDRRRRPEHGPRGRHLRRPGLHDLLPRDDQRPVTRGARPGHPRARRPRQEPPERRAVVDRQRARVRHRRVPRTTSGRCSTWPATPTRPARSASST